MFQTNNNAPFIWMMVSDDERLPNPAQALKRLPGKSIILLRSKNQENLRRMAAQTIPLAHALGHRVLLAGPVRLAQMLGADGAHITEARLKRGAVKDLAAGSSLPKGFILSASAHGAAALRRAKKAGVDFAVLGPALPSKSHANARALGVLRFCRLVGKSPVAVMAIGGINEMTAKRISGAGSRLMGFAAIEAFADKN